MEFEVDENQKSVVTEDERLRAQARAKTLQPINPFLTPDDVPDPIVVTETHGNVQVDLEDTSKRERLIHPASGATTRHSSHFLSKGALIVASLLGFGILGIVSLLIFSA
jgi:hypothetical protein